MLDDDVAAALCAITAFADVAAFESPQELLALGDVYVALFPQCERAYWRGRITPAVSAVTSTSMRLGHACLIWYKSDRVYKILVLTNRGIGRQRNRALRQVCRN